jgi:FAD-dependent oxidoreductase domain-containing protein 1
MPKRDRYDLVIVGAGPFGLASAYHVARQQPGDSVLVLDARSGPGEGSMSASNAMVRDVFSSWDNHLLARNAIAFYRHLMETVEGLRAPVPLLDLYGYLWLLPAGLRDAYLEIVAKSSGSIDARSVPLDELRSCPGLEPTPARWYEDDGSPAPESITGGLFGRNCGALAPEMLAHHYFDEARSSGVEFEFNACVRRLSFEGREELLLHEDTGRPFAFQERMRDRLRIGRVVLGDGRAVRADRVLVAAGAWSESLLHPIGFATGCSPRPQHLYSVSGAAVDELLAWKAPVTPLGSETGPGRMPFVILPTGAALKPVFRQRRLWVELEDSSHPIGTLENPGRDGTLDYNMARLADPSSYATDVLPAVTPYLPQLGTTAARLESSWGGYYHFSPDGHPVLVEQPYGVIFAGGDSGSGIMKADSIGRLVAAAYGGRPEAKLFTGDSYRVDRLSLAHRDLADERIIL